MRPDAEAERQRLLRAYEDLPKTVHRSNPGGIPEHEEILPEWIMGVIETHVDRWVEVMPDGELRTILVGRVPGFRQWIKVVFVGNLETGELHTAYADRRLERRYGGRP